MILLSKWNKMNSMAWEMQCWDPIATVNRDHTLSLYPPYLWPVPEKIHEKKEGNSPNVENKNLDPNYGYEPEMWRSTAVDAE